MSVSRKLKMSALVGAAGLLGVVAFGAGSANAAARYVTDCRGTTKAQVIACCDSVIEKRGRPQWMRVAGKNCASAVACKSGSTVGVAAVATKVCWVQQTSGGKDTKSTGSEKR